MNKFKALSCLAMTILSAPHGWAATCPDTKNITRVDSTYLWLASDSSWSGAFAAPQQAKGYSYYIAHFLKAEWIQLNDSKFSPGYIQCQYQGDAFDEIITFTQNKLSSAKKPSGTHWSCTNNKQFPSVVCSCFSNTIADCVFN